MRETPRSSRSPAPVPRKEMHSGTNWVVYAIGVALLGAILIFLFTWSRGSFLTYPDRPNITYQKIGPLRVSNLGYAVLATVVIQADAADAGWMKQHADELHSLVQQALANADARQFSQPHGLATFQQQLKEAIDVALPSSPVQKVLVTDFIYQSEGIDQ